MNTCLTVALDNQPTVPLHQLIELSLLTLQAPQLPAIASLQRQQPLLQEAAEIEQPEDLMNTVFGNIPLQLVF